MSQSITKIIIHIIFSTKKRIPYLTPQISSKLYAFISKALQNRDCYVLKIGGYSNHIHILCTMSKKHIFENIIREIKICSSKWMKTQDAQFADFCWQKGYGVFSVNPGNLDAIINYIATQNVHHKKFDFQDEFRAILQQCNVEYNEKYLWD
jgi:putative transposase